MAISYSVYTVEGGVEHFVRQFWSRARAEAFIAALPEEQRQTAYIDILIQDFIMPPGDDDGDDEPCT